jgi:hypothetical protein
MKATTSRLARWILFALLCILACVSLLAQAGGTNHRSDRSLVKPKPGIDLTLLHAQLGSQVLRTYSGLQNLQVIQLPPLASPLTFIALYQQSGLVDYAKSGRSHFVRLDSTTYRRTTDEELREELAEWSPWIRNMRNGMTGGATRPEQVWKA